MAERYVAFDVETPNNQGLRMSAIGISIVEDGRVVEEFGSLVNPETHFDPFIIRLTGITPAAAADAPTFPELWPVIAPLLDQGVLLAHNAPFDMGVLAKCLKGYGIHWKPYAQYACTCRMSRKQYPNLINHKLNTVSEALGISLDHHRAASDAHACAEIFCHCLRDGLELHPFLRAYDFDRLRTLGGYGW